LSVSALLGHRIEVRPLAVSKINTGLQIALAALAIADNAFGFGLGSAERYLGYAVAITTILSGGAYMTRWLKELTEREKA
jgi:cardiolipin synthase